MIPITVLILILFTHFIADFALQSDWMAKNKSKSNRALAVHTFVYTSGLSLLMLVDQNVLWVYWAVLNGILHGLTDYVTSRWSSHLWSKGDVHNFFVVIGFDQFIHAATLITTYYWIVL